MGQDREHGAAHGALETPDGHPTETGTSVMGVAREAPAAATGRLMEKLKAEGEEKGEDAFDKRLTVAKELKVGCFVLKIDSDSPVFTGLAVGGSHGSSSDQMVGAPDDPT